MDTYRTPMEPWPALAQYARTVQIEGRNLFYYDAGQTTKMPPFVLVHGLGDEADTWRHILPALAKEHRVIALDLPGFGRSDLPAHPVTPTVLMNSLEQLLDGLGLSEVVLVGHSLGGIICQTLALQHPKRCAALVLVDGGLAVGKTRLDLSLFLYLVPGIGELLYNGLRRNPQAAYNTLRPYYNDLAGLPQVDRNFLFRRVNQRVWSNKQRTAFFSTLRSLVSWLSTQQRGLPERLAAFHFPRTTILWGAQDQIAPASNAHEMAGLLPSESVRLIIVENCGHNLQQEAPEALLQVLQE